MMTPVLVLAVLASGVFISCGKDKKATEQVLMVASTEVPAVVKIAWFICMKEE
jgi:hypothetical protein